MDKIYGINMKVQCLRIEILNILKKNREEHIKIVKEARVGFLKKAEKLLETSLKEVKEGKVKSVSCNLPEPANHVAVYDTVIKMLELHKEEHIELNADEVRQLVENKWSWTQAFLLRNSGYSQSAATELQNSGEEE